MRGCYLHQLTDSKMADARDPPPLFSSVDLDRKNDDLDDLFASAMENEVPLDRADENDDKEGPLGRAGDEDDEKEVPLDRAHEDDDKPLSRAGDEDDDKEVPLGRAGDEDDDKPLGRAGDEDDEKEVPLGRADEDDDDDDLFAEAQTLAKSSVMLEEQWVRVRVTQPQKVGEGMGSYVAYRVSTHTNMPLYRRQQFAVLRRFSDFLGLHDKLGAKFLRSGRIVPPAPEKSVLGSTKIKMTNQADQGSSAEFVERRRASLERYLNRTAQHPVLRVDPDFREFLESETELPRATSTSALSGAGVMRLFNKVGETVNKITYKMDESDPWFEERVQQVDSLDAQMRRLLASVECLVEQRRELASSTAAFAKAAAMLSNCEEHNSLSRALAQLAEVEERVESLHAEQSGADFAVFCELIKDYVALVGAVKDVFHERVKVYQNWQHSQMMLNKKREAKAKLEIMGRADKTGPARDEVIEWEAKVERGQEEFDNISKMIKKEMERFDAVRVKDFKGVVVKYLEAVMNNQIRLIQCWESFLPEAKAIA